MTRLQRTAISILAGLVLVTAGACSSSSGTSGPNGGGPAVNGSDPNSILAALLANASSIKSFHLKVTASGTIKSAALADTSAGDAISGDLKLDGATIEGDVDLANSAADVKISLPAVPVTADQTVPESGEIILVNNVAYYEFGITGATGAKFSKLDLSSFGSTLGALSSGLPVSKPSAGASAMNPNALQSVLAQSGVTMKVVGTDNIGGQDAYHIAFTLPLAMINAGLSAEASGAPVTIDTLSLDVWIYKNNVRPAQAEFKEGSSTIGNVDLTVTITNYDKPVTVNAPAAGNIAP